MLEIRLAEIPEERELAFKLRYQIYVEELGWFDNCDNYEPNHEQKTIEEPLDKTGYMLLAFKDCEFAGTMRINYAKHLDSEDYAKLYKMK